MFGLTGIPGRQFMRLARFNRLASIWLWYFDSNSLPIHFNILNMVQIMYKVFHILVEQHHVFRGKILTKPVKAAPNRLKIVEHLSTHNGVIYCHSLRL